MSLFCSFQWIFHHFQYAFTASLVLHSFDSLTYRATITRWPRCSGPGTAQGMYVPKTTINQENKSTFLLTENGKTSSSRRTKKLNKWYFFVTEKVKRRSENSILSYTWHARWFFHQSTTGGTVCTNASKDTWPAQWYKHHFPQECVW